MALFGNLFKKKECAICGGEIGLLGNRKLEDGNMCKKCAGLLSRWFDDRRHSTVEQIKAQLAYREENKQALGGFVPTRSFGENDLMMVEERGGVPYRFLIAESSDWRGDNPDLILFKNVLSCTLDAERYERELMKTNSEGEEESYFPRRFEYNYDFYVEMQIGGNPYFDDIRFKLNESTVKIVSEEVGGFNSRRQDHTYHPKYRVYQQMFEDIQAIVNLGKSGAAAVAAQPAAPVEQQAPRPKFCPGCGAPASGKFCENCGTKLF